MAKNIFRSGKKARPKTTVKGKRYRCATCRKRSPKPVKAPAPWYCPNCLYEGRRDALAEYMGDKGHGQRILNSIQG